MQPNCSAKLQKMIETLLISTLIIAIAMVFFLVRVLFVKQGTFKSQHIHDSEAMKERGSLRDGSGSGDATEERVRCE